MAVKILIKNETTIAKVLVLRERILVGAYTTQIA